MKQKKKKPVKANNNNKFNFDNEVIIGISSSSRNNKNVKKVTSSPKIKKVVKSNKDKKSKKYKKVMKILTFIILMIGFVCFLSLSPIFNLEEIIVEGNSKVTADEITSLSEINLYENIFLINKKEIKEKIGKNSYIDKIEINRVFPNKIKITVEERTPEFLIEFTEGKYIYLSRNGYILEASNEKLSLPILQGTSTNLEEMIKNQNNTNRLNNEDLEKLNVVLKILNVSQNYEIDNLITKIDISDSKNYKLILETEGKVAFLGDCSDLNTRILWLKEIIISEKGNEGEIFVDGNLGEDAPFFRESI